MKKIKELIEHIEENCWNAEHADNCPLCLSQANGTFLDGLRLALIEFKAKNK